MVAFYNEIDPYAAQWLRNLIAAGHIAPGVVDERSIQDIRPDELTDYTQCHFFAGIGVWSLALRRAGWPDDRPVWTGSCPCQPFSAAGAGAGFADERHLEPDFAWLIDQCRPPVVFGEQVASKAADPWLDLIQVDLEAMGYAFGAVAFPSAGVGAPHVRDRTYWVADADGGHTGTEREQCSRQQRQQPQDGSGLLGMADASGTRQPHGRPGSTQPESSATDGDYRVPLRPTGPVNGLWADADWLFCRDGKWRPVEPGTFPLAHGAPSRVGLNGSDWRTPAGEEKSGNRIGRLRAYGNAINAEAARVFIDAYLDATNG